MTQHEERQAIFKALKDYAKKYNADYYCVILIPPEGQKVRLPGNFKISSSKRGETGLIIEGVVEREVLLRAPERE